MCGGVKMKKTIIVFYIIFLLCSHNIEHNKQYNQYLEQNNLQHSKKNYSQFCEIENILFFE